MAMGDGPYTDQGGSMSEQTAPTEGTEELNEQGKEAAKEFQAITSQEDFDKAIQARIARERAKFSDYNDLKAQAAKFAEFEESQKTEAQKAQERLEAAEKRAAELESKVARAEVAAVKGVDVGLLAHVPIDELEAFADKLNSIKGEQAKGLILPDQGKTPKKPSGTSADRFAAALDEAGF